MNETIDDIKHVHDPRQATIKGAVKIVDIYWYLRRNKMIPDVDLKTFRLIVRTMGLNMSLMLLDGKIIKLPLLMGHFAVIERKPKVKLVNGKVKHNYKVDWGSTVHLWETDEEAKRDKTVVFHILDKLFNVKYYRTRAKYRNKNYFIVRPNTVMTRKLNHYAIENKVVYHINQ